MIARGVLRFLEPGTRFRAGTWPRLLELWAIRVTGRRPQINREAQLALIAIKDAPGLNVSVALPRPLWRFPKR